MKRIILLLLCAFGFTAHGESKIVVRSWLDEKPPIYVGQQVKMVVEVLSNEGWANASRVADIEVPGALLLQSESQGNRLQETITGESYTGQSYELLIYPKRAGTITVPAIPLDVEVKQWGVGKIPQVERKQTDPVAFEAVYPPGAENITDLLCATGLQVKQEWSSKQTEQVMVGDSIKRTVAQSVQGMPGAALIPIRFITPDNATIYPATPDVNRTTDRGVMTGTRSDAATYVFTRAATVELPDIILSWWDTGSNELKQEVLPGRSFDVKPNPAILTPEEVSQKKKAKSGAILAGILAIMGIIFFHRPVTRRWKQWRETAKHSEGACFKRFTQTCKSNDPIQSLTALMQWLDRIEESSVSPQLEQFVTQYGDEKAKNSAAQLTAAALNKTTWSGQTIAADMKNVRKQWLTRQRKEAVAKRILPELNP